MIRRLLPISFVLLLATNPTRGNPPPPRGNLELSIVEAPRELLLKAAAIGSMSPIQSPLLVLRLYAIQVTGACVPGKNAVCSYRYVLVTSSTEDPPVMHAYDLGTVGEIDGIRFNGSESDRQWTLELTVHNFPASAIRSNRRLAPRKKKARLLVDPNQVVQED